jgi:hypothetical protein
VTTIVPEVLKPNEACPHVSPCIGCAFGNETGLQSPTFLGIMQHVIRLTTLSIVIIVRWRVTG